MFSCSMIRTPMIRQIISPGLLAASLGIQALAVGRVSAEEAPQTGEQIYANLCVECHGKQGEGVAGKSDEPLRGERSLESLARYIDRNMPEDAPEKCVGEDAKRVAAYIFEAFYSTAARARNNPPKLDAARLTNRQFRESVADLVGSFTKSFPPGRGMRSGRAVFLVEGDEQKIEEARRAGGPRAGF